MTNDTMSKKRDHILEQEHTPLRLQQVLVKPRNTETEQWRQRRGGLLSLVNTCGEIGLCPPCTEAHPPWRVGPPRTVGGGRRRQRGLTHRAGRMGSSPHGGWQPNPSMGLHPPCGEEEVLPAWRVHCHHLADRKAAAAGF